ncbi:MAG: PAS domain S-box protein [Anaerolineae bacterium]
MKQTILLTDVASMTRQQLRDNIREAAYSVIEAGDSSECMHLFNRHSPSLVILRDSLPDAFELCQKLKSLSSTPILLITAQDNALIERALAAGADDWLMDAAPRSLLQKRIGQLLSPKALSESQVRAQQLEKSLYYIAQGGWGLSSDDFLRTLMIYMGKTLDAAHVFVGELAPDAETIRTVATYMHGEIVSNITYPIRNTPCENVFAKKLCVYERDLQVLFPLDSFLTEFDAVSYIGVPLWNSQGEAVGILSVMDTKPLEQVQLATALLQLVAVRAAHELERAHHERAMHEAEEFARSTLDGLAEHIAIIDETGTILSVNAAWRNFAVKNGGLAERSNEGANYLQVCETAAKAGSEEAALVKLALEEILRGKRTYFEHEYTCHAPNQQRWFVVRVTRFPDTETPRAIIAHDDITMRKHYEAALQESEARYESVVLALAEGIVVQDSSGKLLTVNASAERILGLSADQLKDHVPIIAEGRTIHEDGTPFPDAAHPAYQTLKTGVAQHNVIMGIRQADDSTTWISINTEPLFHPSQRQPYAVVSSFADITARKNAEDIIKLREERYRLISELISDYAFAFKVDENGALVREWNTDSFQLITGYTPDIVDDENLRIYHPDDRGRASADVQDALEGNPNVGEYRIVTAHGETKWVQVYRQPIFDAQGRVIRMYSVTCDISAEKQAEDALIEQKRLEAVLTKERDLNAFRTNLMRTLSHEFRTPLAIMSTACDLLEHYMDRATPEQRQSRITSIRAQIARITEMIDDISVIVQGGQQQILPRTAKLDLEELCRSCVSEVQQSVGVKHRLTFESDGRVTTMLLDKRLVHRTISNLLTNAVKYSPEGSEINTRLFLEDDYAVIEVQDHGLGISTQDQQFVFEPFYRSASVNSIAGTGMGLSIVRECVNQMQGTIHLRSELGAGSTFVMRLPHP